ncbi:MAG: hypothetical protein ACK4PI_08000 [Tepidisphaerales bacterium]
MPPPLSSRVMPDRSRRRVLEADRWLPRVRRLGLVMLAGLPGWVGCTAAGGDVSPAAAGGSSGAVRMSAQALRPPQLSGLSSPATSFRVEREPWSYTLATGQTVPGWVLTSPNYRLHTTLTNTAVAERLIRTLEAGLIAYRDVAPTSAPTTTPMEAWIFAERRHWMDFTRRTTGADARLYLQITRGGYAVGDRFVSYFTAERDALSVAAHEGFHQFVARHFAGRLPPFLEEGLSCTFERVEIETGRGGAERIRINRSINPQRAYSLRTVIDRRATWRLDELIQLHAGRVVGQPGARIEAFYAQSWAFARFLQEYDNGRYLPAFRRWMADTVAGTVVDPTGTHRRAQPLWDPAAVRPILEHYLETDLSTLQQEFAAWCRYIAFDEFPRHWSRSAAGDSSGPGVAVVSWTSVARASSSIAMRP